MSSIENSFSYPNCRLPSGQTGDHLRDQQVQAPVKFRVDGRRSEQHDQRCHEDGDPSGFFEAVTHQPGQRGVVGQLCTFVDTALDALKGLGRRRELFVHAANLGHQSFGAIMPAERTMVFLGHRLDRLHDRFDLGDSLDHVLDVLGCEQGLFGRCCLSSWHCRF